MAKIEKLWPEKTKFDRELDRMKSPAKKQNNCITILIHVLIQELNNGSNRFWGGGGIYLGQQKLRKRYYKNDKCSSQKIFQRGNIPMKSELSCMKKRPVKVIMIKF